MAGKDAHMTLTDRQLIEKGIANRSSKKSIADVIGKNKSTVTRKIKNHRILKKHNIYPIDCEKTKFSFILLVTLLIVLSSIPSARLHISLISFLKLSSTKISLYSFDITHAYHILILSESH